MDNRDTVLSARFPGSVSTEPYVELDLREINIAPLAGRRGQLHFLTKLVFKAADAYKKDQSVIQLWADVRVSGQDGVWLDLGRANLTAPVFFEPLPADALPTLRNDPWTRVADRLALDFDHRQVDDIEQKRKGGQLTFILGVGGVLHHAGAIASLYPSNHQVTYEVSASAWLQFLNQFGYGTYVTIEVPITSSAGLTSDVQKAARALQEAQAAFQRGDYEEAVADCRPGLAALDDADKPNFTLKPWDRSASKGERFYWVQRALLGIAHIAHHPNDAALAASDAAARPSHWERADAEATIAILAALIRHRTNRG